MRQERRHSVPAALFWRLAKVVTQQNANRNRRAVALRREKVELSHRIYDRLIQGVTGPTRHFDATDFAMRVDVDQHINSSFYFSASRALRIRRFQTAIWTRRLHAVACIALVIGQRLNDGRAP